MVESGGHTGNAESKTSLAHIFPLFSKYLLRAYYMPGTIFVA
jgi:hypothetical protein